MNLICGHRILCGGMRPQMDAFRHKAPRKASVIAIAETLLTRFREGIHKKQEGDTQ
jgi:hypothetical protein